MNAPPGVDTDTSGEEFTPPPSPKPDPPKPQFPLTSIFPTKKLKKLRKATAEIKTQTPVEAIESDDDKTPTKGAKRLLKKCVRIAEPEDEPNTDTSTFHTSPVEPIEQVLAESPVSATNGNDPSQVIALLRQMMAKNALDVPAEEEIDSAPDPEPMEPVVAEDTGSNSANNSELPTPIGPSFLKRRPGGLDFSNLFRTKTRPDEKLESAPSTAPPPGPSVNPPEPSESASISPTHSIGTALPQSAPPWLWTGPQNDPSQVTQPYPMVQQPHPPPDGSGYPPWLWNPAIHGAGHDQLSYNPMFKPRGQNQQYFNPTQGHPANPPFPPYYPHPQSLQPWQPYYPQWSTPPHHSGNQSPYDGMANPTPQNENSKPSTEGPPLQSNDLKPRPAVHVDTQRQEASTRPGIRNTRPEGPRLRPPPAEAVTPTKTKAGSIATSITPEHGTRYAHPVRKATSSSRPVVRDDDSSSESPPAKAASSQDERSVRNAKGAKQEHSTTGSGHGSLNHAAASKSTAKRHPHLDKVVRAAGLGHGSPRELKGDCGLVADSTMSRATLTKDPTWTECLISLATCIRLGQSLLTHIEARESSDGGHSHFYRLLTKVMASLLTQRDVVKDMTRLVGNAHGDEISQFAKELQTINVFFRSCMHKNDHSNKDAKKLSDMNGHAARSLEAGGLTHLVGQVFTLTDFLTPNVIKAVTDLLHDWADDTLNTKSVLKALMAIQHEVTKVHQQREASGQASKDEKNGAWTILRYVDLLYRLFVPDDAAAPTRAHETIPGAWPDQTDPRKQRHSALIASSTRPATGKSDAQPEKSEKGNHGKVSSKPIATKTDKAPSPTHRSPRQVISDIVHPKRSDKREEKDTPSPTAAVSGKPTSDKKEAAVAVKHETHKPRTEGRPSDSDARGKQDSSTSSSVGSSRLKPAKEPSTPIKTTKTPDARTRTTLPDLKVEPYHSPKKNFKEQRSHTPQSSPPLSSSGPSPQSSPSQYSEDDDEVPSEGTVSSDEDARSLLAQADSGPARVAPLNIRKRTSGER